MPRQKPPKPTEPAAHHEPRSNPFLNSDDPAVQNLRKLFDNLEESPQFQNADIRHYRLDENHNVVSCSMFEAMVFQVDEHSRIIGSTHIPPDTRVSTVFIGGFMIMTPFHDGNPPRMFETMIFGGPHDGYQVKYKTWEEAERGHKIAVEMAKG